MFIFVHLCPTLWSFLKEMKEFNKDKYEKACMGLAYHNNLYIPTHAGFFQMQLNI